MKSEKIKDGADKDKDKTGNKKDGSDEASGETGIEVEGEKILTTSVPRGTDTTYHTRYVRTKLSLNFKILIIKEVQ